MFKAITNPTVNQHARRRETNDYPLEYDSWYDKYFTLDCRRAL